MFEITIGRSGKNQDKRILLDLDQSPLAVPTTVLLGTGDKKARLAAHYKKCLGSNEDPKLQGMFHFFAQLYGHGNKDNRGLHLVCNCKHNSFHAQVVKDFMIENSDLLGLVANYTVPSEKPVAQTTDDRSIKEILDSATTGVQHPEDRDRLMNFGQPQTSVNLPPEEMAQIQRLIAEDQARESLAKNPQGQQVPDQTQQITE